MYCSRCGAELPEGSGFCSECGNSVSTANQEVKQSSGSSFAWGILGFFVPLAGLVLYLVWRNDKPKDAKAAGIGALIYLGLYIVLLIFVFLMAFISSAM